MAIKNIVKRGYGSFGGGVHKIPTAGCSSGSTPGTNNIHLGSGTMSKAYLGASAVSKIYLGTTVVFST